MKFRVYKVVLNKTVALEGFSMGDWMTWSHGWLPAGFHFKNKITLAFPAAWRGIKGHRNFSPWTAKLSRTQTQTKMFDFLTCFQKYLSVFTVFLDCWTKTLNYSGNFLQTPTPFGIKHPCEGVCGNYQPVSCACVAALEGEWVFSPAGILGAPSSCRGDWAGVPCGISTTPGLTGSRQTRALIWSPAPAEWMNFPSQSVRRSGLNLSPCSGARHWGGEWPCRSSWFCFPRYLSLRIHPKMKPTFDICFLILVWSLGGYWEAILRFSPNTLLVWSFLFIFQAVAVCPTQ